MPDQEDNQLRTLLQAIQSGDAEAFRLLQEHFRPLFTRLRRLQHLPYRGTLGALEDTDLEQEFALILWETATTLETDDHFEEILKRRLNRELKRCLRHERREQQKRATLDPALLAAPKDNPSTLPSGDGRLLAAIASLSPKQQEVIKHIYWGEQTAHQIAAHLSVTPQAVTALRRRAERRLQILLMEKTH
ncbi:MAG: sigma-70 family RNA polymerase sigma factor [Chloroflexi bacterium]|nr:sigma-70 family RNA polymerase sigma factor [Chloroflexota bacterium]